MGWTDLWLRLRALVSRRRAEQDLDAELSFHLEMEARKARAAGAIAVIDFFVVGRVKVVIERADGVPDTAANRHRSASHIIDGARVIARQISIMNSHCIGSTELRAGMIDRSVTVKDRAAGDTKLSARVQHLKQCG